jgi:NodT family efflux transporter outer membrane factor (OMF) lipoprotein
MACRGWLMLGLLLPLAGCMTVGPDYEVPEAFVETQWSQLPDGVHDTSSADTAWWNTFDDAVLVSLLTRAEEANRTLREAEARVERAQALRRTVRATAGPRVDVEGSATRRRTSRNTSNNNENSAYRTEFDIGLDASWELDLFGGVRRASEAAAARVESEMERLHATRLALRVEVARSYYAVRGTQIRVANTQTNIALLTKTLDLIGNLSRLGEASEFDVTRARGQLQLTQSRLPLLDAEIREGIYRLSILVGETPGTLLEEMEQLVSLPALPDLIPVGQASDVLRRRPDIRVAERELAAATADVGAAKADLFPRFDLLGGLGRTADTLDDLGQAASARYVGAGFIRWPVFQSGSIRAGIEAEEAETREAAARYEQTVLEALADAESALIRYVSQRQTTALLRDAVASRRISVELSRRLFETGEEDFLAVLDAERELISVEDELVVSETSERLSLIALYAALGGGWEPSSIEAGEGSDE